MRIVLVTLFLLVLGAGPVAASDLIAAARAGDNAAAIALIDDGAAVNAAEANGTTALHWAAYRGEAALVRRLLDAGAEADVMNDFGATPIGAAGVIGSAPILEMLLEAGADPDTANREGQTPLMAVARTGRVDAARVLLRHGADINVTEKWGGQSALMWAAAQSQPEMVKFLVENGAAANARGAVRDWKRRVTAEPRKKDMHEGGFTPLLYAAREGCIPCARHLLDAGADIDLADPDRAAPLNLAIMNLHFDTAAFLIKAGADVNKWDFAGRTPLYNATDMNTPPETPRPDLPPLDETTPFQLMQMLLARGADPDIQLKRRPQYRDAINERGADIMLSTGATPLLRAARAADLDAMKLLLDHGAMPELPNQYGVTPFMAAAGVGFGVRATRGGKATEEQRIAALQLLLDAGAKINRRTLSQGRVAPPGLDNFLWRTRITKGNQNYIFSYVPPDGRTAIHGAARNGWTKVVQFLADNGAELNVAGTDGKTPLDLAAGRYEPEILVPPADPFPETMALLESLCANRSGCRFAESGAQPDTVTLNR